MKSESVVEPCAELRWQQYLAKQWYSLTNGLLGYLPTGEFYYLCRNVRDCMDREVQMIITAPDGNWTLQVGYPDMDGFITQCGGFDNIEEALQYAIEVVNIMYWRVI